MSYKFVDMVCDLDVTDIQFRLLVHIARHADVNGTNSFPSIPTLAAAIHRSERHVQRIIKELEELRLIKRGNTQGGRGKPTIYTLTFPAELVEYHNKKHARRQLKAIGKEQEKIVKGYFDQLHDGTSPF